VSFYTSFYSPQGIIADADVDLLKDILGGMTPDGKKLLLIINSPGGDPLAAERFIKVCREHSDNDYWVIVPGKAKSAATMISLGASKIIMTKTSELGPIDIQVPWGEDLVPAHIIVSAYEELMEKGTNLPADQRIEPILQQLQVFNAPQIERWKLARDLSRDIAKKVLQEGNFRGLPEGEAASLLEQFVNPRELKDHGRPIFHSDLAAVDKNNKFQVELLEPQSKIYEHVHEYHMRAVFSMTPGRQQHAKLFETERTAFAVSITG